MQTDTDTDTDIHTVMNTHTHKYIHEHMNTRTQTLVHTQRDEDKDRHRNKHGHKDRQSPKDRGRRRRQVKGAQEWNTHCPPGLKGSRDIQHWRAEQAQEGGKAQQRVQRRLLLSWLWSVTGEDDHQRQFPTTWSWDSCSIGRFVSLFLGCCSNNRLRRPMNN